MSSGSKAQPSSFMHGKKPLNIIIIGGSCAGLFAGILLKRRGHNVHILESAVSDERMGLAAGVGLSDWVRRFLDENDRLADLPLGTPIEGLQILDWSMNMQTKIPIRWLYTTWDALYYRLRANFDAFQSPYSPNPPPLDSSEGHGKFETGKRAVSIEDHGETVKIIAEDVETGHEKTYEADMVITADGANSAIRRQLFPDLQRDEPGYVLWRGTVPVKDLSKSLLDKLDNKTIMYRMQSSYAIIYPIPGVNGTLAQDEREINIAWYTWQTPLETHEILTDKDGHTHRSALPKGQMRAEIWARQLASAHEKFSPQMRELVDQIRVPFVSVISSHGTPRAAFMGEKMFLIGDALAQKQPNTGQGVNYAAKNAMQLVEVVDGVRGVREWEDEQVQDGVREGLRSVAFGARHLDGWAGWMRRWVNFQLCLYVQRWKRWLAGSQFGEMSTLV